ncbi:glycosyltransferase family 2 protein [Sphingobacterium pedocola]|uniref:Glycosyltransferase n=1 Tax=Sphingobacterium pedocola TaxID=2082722 RepID=A0ABR9TAC5_9SPHI|nr:glycosyltransferase family 2 protein [Sphingobacterium pedocola]MBE8722312.1 glycosyltransferase [Sphingobacterium pedocola]
MKLSIVTINLNNKFGLLKTFTSIKEQSFQQFEYIVVDGSSNDGSKDVLESNDRIDKWISEKDSGVYDAMNKGVKMATGQYILFLNSGDILYTSQTLENIFPNLNDVDLLYGDLAFDNIGKPVIFNYPEKLSIKFLFESSLGHPSTFIKKDLFYQYGNYDTTYRIAADWSFFLICILRHNVSTKHLNQVVSIFDTTGMSSVPDNFQLIQEERQRFLNKEFPLFYEDYLKHTTAQPTLEKIQSSKGFRLLKALGVKKFQ